MLSINTNLSSIITQRSMKQSTNKLNQAIERMTTGAKINHAKDNAANYSISTDMSTQINALDVAEDNISMGIDMLTTAESSLDLINSKLQRLRDLVVQSSNGTYGAESKQAINSEVNALVDEMQRLHSTTEYNGKKILGDENALPTRIEMSPVDFKKRDTTNLKKLAEIEDSTVDLADGTYSISTPAELAQLATMTNAGLVSEGDEFVLADDIDLIDYTTGEGWTPIGTSTNKFAGTFDGNGYTITNLFINRPSGNMQGLFGDSKGNLQNINIVDAHITANGAIGGLTGVQRMGTISNCHVSGLINATLYSIGGLVGQLSAEMKNCSSDIKINCGDTCRTIGGLVGDTATSVITKIDSCYAKAEILGSDKVGGFIGSTGNAAIVEITNCYSEANIVIKNTASRASEIGGFCGRVSTNTKISKCYSTGKISGRYDGYTESAGIGGFLGSASPTAQYNLEITNCYSTVDINYNHATFIKSVGGFVGQISSPGNIKLKNCYSSGNVFLNASKIDNIGGFVASASGSILITNCYTLSNLYLEDGSTGFTDVGGFGGMIYADSYNSSIKVENCYNKNKIETNLATGVVNTVRGFVGRVSEDTGYDTVINIKNSYMLIDKDSDISTIWGCRDSGTELSIENSYHSQELANSGLNLFADKNGNVVNDSDLTTQLRTCGTDNPFKFYYNQQTGLQIGTSSDKNSRITVDTTCSLKYMNIFRNIGLYEDDYLTKIDELLNDINKKQTQIGASNNRLVSAIDEITVRRDNLVSSRSTIRDADIAEVSSEYIRQQILQSASATLMATANQSPSIALQLI